MKRECTLVQGKSNKMVTSAMPPSHYLRSNDSKNTIIFFHAYENEYGFGHKLNLD